MSDVTSKALPPPVWASWASVPELLATELAEEEADLLAGAELAAPMAAPLALALAVRLGPMLEEAREVAARETSACTTRWEMLRRSCWMIVCCCAGGHAISLMWRWVQHPTRVCGAFVAMA